MTLRARTPYALTAKRAERPEQPFSFPTQALAFTCVTAMEPKATTLRALASASSYYLTLLFTLIIYG